MAAQVVDVDRVARQGQALAVLLEGLHRHASAFGHRHLERAVQAHHLAMALRGVGAQPQRDVEGVGEQHVLHMFARDGQRRAAAGQIDALGQADGGRGEQRGGRQDLRGGGRGFGLDQGNRLAHLVGGQRTLGGQGQDVTVGDAQRCIGVYRGAVRQKRLQRHVLAAACGKGVGDGRALFLRAVGEGPDIDGARGQGIGPRHHLQPDFARGRARGIGSEQKIGHAIGFRMVHRRPDARDVKRRTGPDQEAGIAVIHRRGDKEIVVVIGGKAALILGQQVVLHHPAGLPFIAGDVMGDVLFDGDVLGHHVDPDPGQLDEAVGAVRRPAVAMQDGVVGDAQPVTFADIDPVHMAVGDHVVGDRDVAVIHFRPGLAHVDHFIAHEDRMSERAVADVDGVAGDQHVGGRRGGVGRPELDHVGVIAAACRGADVVQVVVGNQPVGDRGIVHHVRPHVGDFVAGHLQVVDLEHLGAAEEPLDQVVLEGDAGRFADRHTDAEAVPVGIRGLVAGDIAVEGAVADRDIGAVIDLEGSHIGVVAVLVGVVEGDAVQREIARVAQVQPAEHGRVVGVVRDQRDLAGELRGPVLAVPEFHIAPVATFQADGFTALCRIQRVLQFGEIGGVERLRHEVDPWQFRRTEWGCNVRPNLTRRGVVFGEGLRRDWEETLCFEITANDPNEGIRRG